MNGNGECSKRQLAPDERSVWDDYLDLAQLSIVRGKVCIANGIGYTAQQLSQILKTPEETLKRAEHNLLKLKMIEIDNNRVITIQNWKKYQSEYNRQLQYRVTSKGNTKSVPIDTDTETEPETVTDIEKKKIKTIPPDINEVISYCKERKNNVDPEVWYNHYTAKGWLIGKTKMVDWKAAVRTWEKNSQAPINKPKQPVVYKAPDPKDKFKFVPETKELIKTLSDKKGIK